MQKVEKALYNAVEAYANLMFLKSDFEVDWLVITRAHHVKLQEDC
jgi:hypothetical protein